MTENAASTSQYILDLTPGQARIAQQALQKAGLPFEPMAAAAIIEEENDSYWNMKATDLEDAIQAINDHLLANGQQPQVPEPETLEQTLEALDLACRQFSWQNWRPDYESWRDRHSSWQETTRQYPKLFPTP